jgi:RNA recognition motif-containing protein
LKATRSFFFANITYESQQAPNPSNVLGVFGLSIRTQERDLDEEFSRFGRVEKVTIVYDQRVGLPAASVLVL